MGFFLFLIPSPTSPAMVAGDAKAESGARNHLSQPGASGDVKENGEDFFWHLNVENMGKDHIIYGRLYGRLLYIIVIHIISWYFLWSYWILGAHGHMALQIVLLSVSGFFTLFFHKSHLMKWCWWRFPRGMDRAGHAGFDQQPALGKVLGSAGRSKRIGIMGPDPTLGSCWFQQPGEKQTPISLFYISPAAPIAVRM